MRAADLKALYTSASVDEVKKLVAKYRIRYVVVGPLERKDFPAGAFPMAILFRSVFSEGGTTLYGVAP